MVKTGRKISALSRFASASFWSMLACGFKGMYVLNRMNFRLGMIEIVKAMPRSVRNGM
jgi:hypothetical protein